MSIIKKDSIHRTQYTIDHILNLAKSNLTDPLNLHILYLFDRYIKVSFYMYAKRNNSNVRYNKNQLFYIIDQGFKNQDYDHEFIYWGKHKTLYNPKLLKEAIELMPKIGAVENEDEVINYIRWYFNNLDRKQTYSAKEISSILRDHIRNKFGCNVHKIQRLILTNTNWIIIRPAYSNILVYKCKDE